MTWALGHGLGNGGGDDPDCDGVPNLIEYALGLDPKVSTPSGLPVTFVSGNSLAFSFNRPKSVTDVAYKVEATNDLTSWTEIWSSVDHPYGGGANASELVTVLDAIPVSAAASRFLRLRTELLPYYVTMAPLGDSRTAIISYDTASNNMTSLSHINWANALNQQKFPITGNFGISGAVTDTIIANMLAPALATHPTFMPILMGVNDVKILGFNADHTMANIAQAANAAIAQGTTPILFTDPGSEMYNATQAAFINGVNARIVAYCAATPKAVLFDMASLVSVQRSPTIIFKTGWSYDGIHLQTLGAYYVGLAFGNLLNSLGVSTPPYPGLSGNLLSNADFSTQTGGSTGTGNTGILPASYSGSRDNANCAVNYAVNTRAGGEREIVVTLTTSSPTKLAGMRLSQTVPILGINPGDSVQAGVQVDIDPGSVNLADIRVEVTLTFTDGTFTTTYCFDDTTERDTISSIPFTAPLSLSLRCPKNPYPADKVIKSIAFRLGARMMPSGDGYATIRFRNPWCKVVAP